MKSLGTLAVLVIVWTSACGQAGSSTIGRYGLSANFPMFFTTSGTSSNGLYRVDEVSVGQVVASSLVVGGLTTPGGLALDRAGNIFVAETEPSPDGRIIKINASSLTQTALMTGLDYPTGVAVDGFNQVYAVENGQHRVQKLDNTGKLSLLIDGTVRSPEKGFFDSSDNLLLVEAEDAVVSRINPSGQREVISGTVEGIRDATVNQSGTLHVLSIDPNTSIGQVLRITSADAQSVVASDLINPTAIAFDGDNALYIAEGAPSNRISRLAAGESVRRVIIETEGEPAAIAFLFY